MLRLAAGIEHGRVYANVGGVTISDPDCYITVSVMLWFAYFSVVFIYSRDLHKKEETMLEAHCMSFPCTELLLFNYAKINTVFHSMAPLRICLWNGFQNCSGAAQHCLPHLTPDSTRQFSRDLKTWSGSETMKRVEREYDAPIRVTFSSGSS